MIRLRYQNQNTPKTNIMRKLLLFVLAPLFAFAANAQVQGKVADADGKPLNGVTISLLKDSAIVKLAVTKENGTYIFSGIKEGTYRVSASHIGFTAVKSAPFAVKGNDVVVPVMQLPRATGNLQNVTVTAKKPLVEMKADKTILNVEGTINSTGSDALELLRKAPGVMVDKDENLSIAGKTGVQVYIDGRPSPLSGQDLATYLKTIQSAQIESIEIITNPSAKYEAAGNAGIINIRFKKNKALGTNGSVNAGWNIGTYAKYNTGINLNHRNAKMNIYGSYNYNNSKNESSLAIYRTITDTLFDQKGLTTFAVRSHSFKGGIDYTINKQSSIGAIVNGTLSDPSVDASSNTPIIYRPTNTVDRILKATNHSGLKRDNINFNLNYNYNGKDGKSLVLNADHGYYDINTDQYQPNDYYNASGTTKINSVSYRMISPTKIHISSFKADYEQNFAKGKLGIGGKTAFITTDNNFQRYNVTTGGDIYDKDRSNRFKYQENINALYVNYNRAWEGIMLQAGVRAENTVSEGTSTGLKNNGSGYVTAESGFRRNYTDLFPSAAITFNKNPMKQWSLSFSRRIDRPAYQDLNPFEMKLDEYTFMKGNTNLRPQYTNSFGVSHTYKYKLNIGLNYSHVKDIFTQLIDTAEQSKSFISKKNLATQDIVSLNVSYPIMYKNFTSFVNVSSNYSMYKANFGNGRIVDLNAFGLNAFAQNSLKFGKTKTWTGELTAFYNAPTIYQAAFKGRSLWAIDMGMQKQLMQGKATLKASVSDVFNTLRFRGTQEFAGQRSEINTKWESRQFKLAFTFRFGSNTVKGAKQRATGAEEENKRVQQGGGGIGIGQ
jgi:iron complex outermembrane receptor protein